MPASISNKTTPSPLASPTFGSCKGGELKKSLSFGEGFRERLVKPPLTLPLKDGK